MRNETKRKAAIKAGLAYIAGQQMPDGGFESFSSPLGRNFKPIIRYRTTFTASLILGALANSPVPGSLRVRRRAATFLIEQRGPTGSFNYWAKNALQRRDQPYPDDLDDTFCALSALYLHDPATLTPAALAQSVKLLLAAEAEVGGPYRTWLVPTGAGSAWQDVDLAVNTNINYFLSLVSEPLPHVQKLLDTAIMTNAVSSPYYPTQRPLLYYASRNYGGQQRQRLITLIRKSLEDSSSPLSIALCLGALGHLGDLSATDMPAIRQLADLQAKDGSWVADAFCLDPAVDGQAYCNGATALTTAFAVEALHLYEETIVSKAAPMKNRTDQTVDRATREVLAMAEKDCGKLGEDLRIATRQSLQELAYGRNGSEIIGLSRNFIKSLSRSPTPYTKEMTQSLGLANLYGWLAYTIYDDFLDEEGRPELLSVANVAHRHSFTLFLKALLDHATFQVLVTDIFDTIDGANAWELAHCRFERRGERLIIDALPEYGDLSKLAERSLGHSLAPLAILAAEGYGEHSATFHSIRRAIKHYLIARQLNDDAHDWADDLERGHITYVAARLLVDLKITPGSYDIAELLTQARKHFWHSTLSDICVEAQRHISLSRRALSLSGILTPQNVFAGLLDGLASSLTEALAKQRETEIFLQQYSEREAPQWNES